jgi:hypothetical protein
MEIAIIAEIEFHVLAISAQRGGEVVHKWTDSSLARG